MNSFDAFAAQVWDNAPIMILYLHIIISAILPIYAGAHASLSRPSSASKPKRSTASSTLEDDEEEETVQQMEGLTPSDAIVFPVTAGLVLAGLYWLITRYGADIVNLILSWYFAGVGVFSVAKLVNDGVAFFMAFGFPGFYEDNRILYKIMGQERIALEESDGERKQKRSSPLPGAFSRLTLPTSVENLLWGMRDFYRQKYAVTAYVKGILDVNGKLTLLNVASSLIGVAAIAYNVLVAKPWWLTNVQGFAVSYLALQVMSPTSFATGSLVLAGLFCYDIWAVFFTPLMVTVAKNLDQPIKLLFPRPEEPDAKGRAFSMLGLGDIVLPGLMIGLALRFDLYLFYLRKQKKPVKPEVKVGSSAVEKAPYHSVPGQWASLFWTRNLPKDALPVQLKDASFPKRYFTASLIGYILGMIATLGVMSVFHHAQPALLYLVPGVVISIWSTGLVRGELKEMWDFTEEVTGEAVESNATEAKHKEQSAEKQTDDDLSFWDKLKKGLFSTARDDPKSVPKQSSKEEKPAKTGTADADMAEKSEKQVVDSGVLVSLTIKRSGPASSGSHSHAGSNTESGMRGEAQANTNATAEERKASP